MVSWDHYTNNLTLLKSIFILMFWIFLYPTVISLFFISQKCFWIQTGVAMQSKLQLSDVKSNIEISL